MISQDDMTDSSVVAIWVGNHTDELEIDEYIGSPFEKEFDFRISERRGPEVDAQAEPVAIRDLLDGFSMCENWLDQAVEKCSEIGLDRASSAAVFHFLRYDPTRCKVSDETAMKFIGNFDW